MNPFSNGALGSAVTICVFHSFLLESRRVEKVGFCVLGDFR
jgi:hypothetical protein